MPPLLPHLFVLLFCQDWDLVNKLVILVGWILPVHTVDTLHVDSQNVGDLFAGVDVCLDFAEDCFESVEAFGFPTGLGCGLVFLWLFGLDAVSGRGFFACSVRYRLVFHVNSTPSPSCRRAPIHILNILTFHSKHKQLNLISQDIRILNRNHLIFHAHNDHPEKQLHIMASFRLFPLVNVPINHLKKTCWELVLDVGHL